MAPLSVVIVGFLAVLLSATPSSLAFFVSSSTSARNIKLRTGAQAAAVRRSRRQQLLLTSRQQGRQPRPLMATPTTDAADGSPPHLPEHPPYPTYPGWWPLAETLVARGSSRSPIYTFVSQFAEDREHQLSNEHDGHDDRNQAPPPPSAAAAAAAAAADVAFLRGLNLEGLMAGGAGESPLRRLMISPTASAVVATGAAAEGGGNNPRYGMDHLPTPATLVADLQATANFMSAIADLNNDGSGGPLPYLGYNFTCTDEVHEDEAKQYLFSTLEEVAELEAIDSGPEESIDYGFDLAYKETTLRSRAQLAALKQYVLNHRLFFVLIHTDRWEDGERVFPYCWSSDVLLLALGVSPATGNLVGVIAIQVCHNLCD